MMNLLTPTDATDAFAASISGTYGTFALTRDDTAGTLSWTYTLDRQGAASCRRPAGL